MFMLLYIFLFVYLLLCFLSWGNFVFSFLINWILFQENVPLEEVFQTLRCDRHGLTAVAAQERLVIFGYNKLEEKQVQLLVFDCPICSLVAKYFHEWLASEHKKNSLFHLLEILSNCFLWLLS